MTALVYVPALDNEFTNWDDQVYVTANPAVTAPSPSTLLLAVLGFHFENYQPLTILSLTLDHALWGLAPGAFILHNVLLHLLATALAFALMRRLLASPTAAGLAAAFFGLHPMHVEAVAWVSSRKTVLSTVLSLAAVLLFLHWRSGGGSRRLSIAVASFTAAALAKATAVTMAPVMAATDVLEGRSLRDRRTLVGLAPFVAAAIVLGGVALLARPMSAGEPDPYFASPDLSLPSRALVAGWAFTTYILRLLAPIGLSPFYPWPVPLTGLRLVVVSVGAVAALGLLAAALAVARRAPVVTFGIAFFTLTIAPLLQLTQVGRAVMADRFVYPPSLGLALVAGWSIVAAGRRWPRARSLLIGTCVAWLFTLGAVTAARCNVWQDSEALWSEAVIRQPRVAWLWLNRADARLSRNDLQGALADVDRSLELAPTFGDAAFTRGVIHEKSGAWAEALRDYTLAIELNSGDSAALAGRGLMRMKMGEPAAALADLDRSLALKDDAHVRYNRGLARSAAGDNQGAADDFASTLQARPGWTDAEVALGATLRKLGQTAAARAVLDAAVTREPANVLARSHRAWVRLEQGDFEGALHDVQRALAARPGDGLSRLVMAQVLLAQGRRDEGCAELERLIAEGNTDARAIVASRCIGG